MKKILRSNEKVLYSDGDEKYGSELVLVAKRTTTPTSDNTPKIVHCVKYKTLCDALRELAEYERKEGTEKFVKGILDRDKLIRGELVINHHYIVGGGDPKDYTIEDTEFRDPRLPYFVDIEYIEVGYAMTRQHMQAEAFNFAYWLFGKVPVGIYESLKSSLENKKFKAEGFGSLPSHRPNIIGLRVGELIAKRYDNISQFTEEFCKDECK